MRTASSIKTDLFSKAGLMLVKDFHGKDPKDLAEKLSLPEKKVESIIMEAELIIGNRLPRCD